MYHLSLQNIGLRTQRHGLTWLKCLHHQHNFVVVNYAVGPKSLEMKLAIDFDIFFALLELARSLVDWCSFLLVCKLVPLPSILGGDTANAQADNAAPSKYFNLQTLQSD